MQYIRFAVFGLLTVLWASFAMAADDFRIETKVFAGKNKTPVSQNITLFKSGLVYDYLSDPDRVAVFDKRRGRFIVLDPQRKIKMEVKTDDVTTFVDKFHDRALKSSIAFMRFAAEPEFDITLSEDGELVLASQYITYRLLTEPAATPSAVAQFHEFTDWYARYNAMANPGSMPPFPRLVVNEELASRGLIPSEVQLTIPAQTPGVPAVSMRSEHHVAWRLIERDNERISETANQLTTFKMVDFAEFQPSKE